MATAIGDSNLKASAETTPARSTNRRTQFASGRSAARIATVALLGLALAGLYGLILLNREPQQITEWMGGVGLIGSIAGAATGYYFGGRRH